MWAARVYEADKRAADVCTQMQVNGFLFDRKRGDELSEILRQQEVDARKAADDAVGRTIKAGPSGGFALKDLNAAFFDDLKAPIFFKSNLTGRPSLGVDALRAYAACSRPRLAELAMAVIEWRRARKLRVTYIDRVQVGDDLRVHPTWHNYGAISGRFSCKEPNLMNLPRKANDPTCAIVKGGIRSLYCARPGYVIVGFDAKQLEMRVAAYASGDEAMIRSCLTTDMHAANAEVIFADAFRNGDDQFRTKARDLAKSSGFAVCYLAEALTVYTRLIAAGANVTLPQVEALLARMKRGFTGYYRWQDARLLDAIREGFTDEPVLGRRRWLGHDPSPTECANFPIQGGAAGVMNIRLPMIVETLRDVSPMTRIVAQVHDAGYFEAPERDAPKVENLAREVFEAPHVIRSSGRPIEAVFPIDSKIAERWS